jgi:hypothetical protein
MERVAKEYGHLFGPRLDTEREERVTEGIRMGELVLGAGVIILSILGLAGVLPAGLLGVSVIVVGGAFLMGSGAIASRLIRGLFETGETEGMMAQFIGGVSGIILGVLALLGMAPGILLPVSAMVFGFTLLFGLGSRLSNLEIDRLERCATDHETAKRVAVETTSAASAILGFLGLGAFTLGFLSLVGLAPLVLALIATLIVGVGVLFVSAATVFVGMEGFAGLCSEPVATT